MQQFDICRTGSSLLNSYVQMTASFEGKDKVTKVVQYGARFFCWYFRSIAGDLEMEERYEMRRVPLNPLSASLSCPKCLSQK